MNKENYRKKRTKKRHLRVLVTVRVSEPLPIHSLLCYYFFMDCGYLTEKLKK